MVQFAIKTDSEPKFFIFSITAAWGEKGKFAKFVMNRTDVTKGDMDTQAQIWWAEFKDFAKSIDPGKLTHLSAKYFEHETWCVNFFNHFTFDDGQNDSDVRLSFLRYVERRYDDPKSRARLMGADNLSSWKGPCRCDNCKALGVLYIDHLAIPSTGRILRVS